MTPAPAPRTALLAGLLVLTAALAGACEREAHTGEPAGEKVELVAAGSCHGGSPQRNRDLSRVGRAPRPRG